MRYTRLVTILAILALFALVGTAVFVYLPGDITVSPVAPPVIFQPGSNANGADLAGLTISVTIGANSSSFSITVHPTYQRTYYHDVVQISNPTTPAGDNYFFGVNVLTPLGSPYRSAQMIIWDTGSGAPVLLVDLQQAGLQGWPTSLPDGAVYRVDFVFELPEGVALPAPATVQIEFVYSPQNTVAPP